jgi:hypothetical protein
MNELVNGALDEGASIRMFAMNKQLIDEGMFRWGGSRSLSAGVGQSSSANIGNFKALSPLGTSERKIHDHESKILHSFRCVTQSTAERKAKTPRRRKCCPSVGRHAGSFFPFLLPPSPFFGGNSEEKKTFRNPCSEEKRKEKAFGG